MTYKYNLHQPVLSEELAKELFSPEKLMASVKAAKEREEKGNDNMTNKNTPVLTTTIELMEVTVEITAKIDGKLTKMTKVIYEPEVKSYRLKFKQTDKDTLKLDWRSYEFVDGSRGKKLEDGIVFIHLNKGDEEDEIIISGEHAPFGENEGLKKHLLNVTNMFLDAGYDEHEQWEIVKKVVC